MLLLSLSVVALTTGAADAATTNGPWAAASFKAGTGAGGGIYQTSCNVGGQYVSDSDGPATIKGTLSCSMGFMIGSADVTLSAEDAGGCHVGDPVTLHVDDSGNGPTAVAFTIEPGGAEAANCPVAALCYDVDGDERGPDSSVSDGQGCVPWGIGSPPSKPVAGGQCTIGGSLVTVNAPIVSFVKKEDTSKPFGPYYYWTAEVQYSFGSSGTAGPVEIYVLGGGSPEAPVGQTPTVATAQVQVPSSGTIYVGNWSNGSWRYTEPERPKPYLYGVGVSTQTYSTGTVYYVPGQYPRSGQNYYLGLTDPGNMCQNYWGQKVADVANSDVDVPIGPVATAPTDPGPPAEDVPAPDNPQGSGCDGFSLTDPSTWAGAGICQLVKIFGQVVKLIADLPKAVAEAIGNLFIPSDGALRDAFDDVRDAWGDSAVGQWGSAVSGLAPSDASQHVGCAGPEVSLPIGDDPIVFHPLDACSGTGQTLAGLCKAVLSAGIVVAGAMGCVRVLGSGFGWNPGGGSTSL